MSMGANAEIEDVLASLRRLVVDTDSPPPRRLVLTATQRIDGRAQVGAPSQDRPRHETRPALLVLTNPLHSGADAQARPPASTFARDAAPRLARSDARAEASAAPGLARTDAAAWGPRGEADAASGTARAPMAERGPDATVAVPSAPDTGPASQDVDDDLPPDVATWPQPSVAPGPEASVDDAAGPAIAARAAPPRTPPDVVVDSPPTLDEDWTIGALAMPFFRHRNGHAALHAGAASQPGPAFAPRDVAMAAAPPVDEPTLRRLVAEVLREELQGELGERMTRNIRKLVRREVAQALAERLPLPDPRAYD